MAFSVEIWYDINIISGEEALNILFVCSGNTCRSPMAAYLGAALGDKFFPDCGFRFDSAGVTAAYGDFATDDAVTVMAEWGIDLSDHRSKPFRVGMADKADLIICMTEAHKRFLIRECPAASKKICLIGEVSGSGGHIPDPYGRGLDIYRLTRNVLKEEITETLRALAAKK